MKTLETIKNFFLCNINGEIEILSEIKNFDTEIQAILIIKGKNGNNEFELLRSLIDKYKIDVGDRKNNFMKNQLKSILNVIVQELYEYL